MSEKHTEENKQIQYPDGLKWTKQRKRVYQILEEAREPLSAVQIYTALEKSGETSYALSTVYRIMAAFEEQGLVQKSTWMGEDTTIYELRRGGHVHYAICLDCHKRISLEHCPVAHMQLEQETGDFTITAHKLELYGYCKDCKAQHTK